MKKILVYGWYHKSNIGDELFKDAFRHLFPEYSFTFTDYITKIDLLNVDAVFFGGGSFLYNAPEMQHNLLELLLTKHIFYIGIGVELIIDKTHQLLMERAKLIAIRNADKLESVLALNNNVMLIPDLVYALPYRKINNITNKSVLVLPNIEIVPRRNSPYYAHISWAQFKSELSQFLDELIECNYKIDFAPMCSVKGLDDMGAIYEILNMMQYRQFNIKNLQPNMDELAKVFSAYDTIITQRYHGMVLAEAFNKPCITIAHHDKLNNNLSNTTAILPYYGMYKKQLYEIFHKNVETSFINLNSFEKLKEEITKLL